jgi:hypothetical protein
MNTGQELLEILRRIEANQVKALEAQAEHLSFAKAQAEKSLSKFGESQDLQRSAILRAQRIARIIFLIVFFLILVVIYVGFKSRLF